MMSHVGELLDKLGWPELQERRQRAVLTFFYKLNNNRVNFENVLFSISVCVDDLS